MIYKEKFSANLTVCYRHLQRLNDAFTELEKTFNFPISTNNIADIVNNRQNLAYSDQIIYRFAKLQDYIGSTLFKSLLTYQGENTDKPFLDILNGLEKINIVNVDDWFELRELRNSISHDYDNSYTVVTEILNEIYVQQDKLAKILSAIKGLL